MAVDPRERKDKGNQVTVAWTHIPLTTLNAKDKATTHKIEL